MRAVGWFHDVLEVNNVVFSLLVNRNVASLDAPAECFNDVPLLIDEDRRMIPARVFPIRSPIPESLAEADHPTRPTRAVSQNEIARVGIGHLLAGRELLDGTSMERNPRPFREHGYPQAR